MAPCETPYFATRGRGDMRGVPNRSTQIAPRRWCGAVLPLWLDAYHFVCQWCSAWLCGVMTACHRLRGGFWGAVWWSPHVATTPRGEIRGYARLQPLAGWRKCSPLVIICRRRSGSDGIPAMGRHATSWLSAGRSHRRGAGPPLWVTAKIVPCSGRGRARGYILSEAGYFTTTDCVLTPVLTM